MEIDLQGFRLGGLNRGGKRCERLRNLVPDVNCQSTQISVVFRLDSDLQLLVFIQNTLRVVYQSLKPLRKTALSGSVTRPSRGSAP